MMHTWDFITVGLTAISVVSLWREGSLFDVPREKTKAWQGMTGKKQVLSLIGHALHCYVCLAFWVSMILTIIYYLTAELAVIRLAFSALAAMGLALTARVLQYSRTTDDYRSTP
jgi:hypothetical protein